MMYLIWTNDPRCSLLCVVVIGLCGACQADKYLRISSIMSGRQALFKTIDKSYSVVIKACILNDSLLKICFCT